MYRMDFGMTGKIDLRVLNGWVSSSAFKNVKIGIRLDTQKWTPLIGQRGSDSKVESDNIIMLPVRAV